MKQSVSNLSVNFKVNFDYSINSGQVFLWKKIDAKWYGIDGKRILVLEDSQKFKKISIEDAYDEAKRNAKAVYGLESLNILAGDYTSDGKQLQKLSNVKLTTVRDFLQASSLS